MSTKWNALKFYPGLVGGHCIGVDPYYFIYEAEKLGYHSQIILAGRKINDGMGNFIADAAIKQLILSGKRVRDSKVYILGITYKENCPDTRNSKVGDIIKRLREYGIEPFVVDPVADARDARREYGIGLVEMPEVKDADCVILAVAHDEFRRLDINGIDRMFASCENGKKVIIDVKSILVRETAECRGYRYWRL
jgi:UDP-N-acetyl-D-galactosamine dehydrogenase